MFGFWVGGERNSEDEQNFHVSIARNWRRGVLRFHPGIVGHSVRCAKVRTTSHHSVHLPICKCVGTVLVTNWKSP